MHVLRTLALVVVLVVAIPLGFTICIAWGNDHPTTLLGLMHSVVFWQAFFWSGMLFMAYLCLLVHLVRSGRIVVVAGECNDLPGEVKSEGLSEIGIHPVTNRMTFDGIDPFGPVRQDLFD
ncbi:hypothetical protein PQR02_26525 [Paraburkholderia sediminicola]|uniref:Uncharacterized protein n=1 Tax=Paraburkholderia rhynchosiae TaxID=487049 RepID=A0ACC7NI69_9BURK